MTSFRWVRGPLVLAALGLLVGPARSEHTGSGSEAPIATEPDRDDDGAGSGSGSAVVAPADPKARSAWLRERIAAAIAQRPTLAAAKIAVAAQDLQTGAELASRNADVKLSLASNAKLLTTIAALRALGAGFRWRTAVFGAEPDDKGKVTGDLYLRGRGDPTLSVAGLAQLAADVAARGVREIEGKLVVDASYFDNEVEPPHFNEQPKETAAFRAPVASLGVNRSAITITVMEEPGGGASVSLDPPNEYVKLGKVEVTSVERGRTRLRVDQRARPRPTEGVELDVRGQIRTREGSWDLRRRIDDPVRFTAELFKRALDEHGVRIKGRGVGSGTVPATLRLLAHHDSAPLSDVVRLVNKHSDNYIAETLLKTLGAERKTRPGPATWADGIAALQAQLAQLGLAPNTYRCTNGSGLFSSTEVSAKQLLVLLAAAHRDYRIAPDFVGSLPAGGYDGTLARRWIGKPAQGRIRAKTGTLDKVSTLAGYIGVDGGHLISFAILVNDIPTGQRGAVRSLADELVEIFAAYLGAT